MKPRRAADGDESNAAIAIRGSLDSSDAAVRAVLMDTRSSQALEPVKLPTKLRTRIEKAQRRAAAAKDGVSIFTASSDSKELQSQQGQSSTQPGRQGKSLVVGLEPDAAPEGTSGNQEKNHLPAVVLSHKMRDFEAKTHVNSLLLDPLDKSLNRLSIEDKERVMLRMQTKIQQITADIDANFIRIKQALDANGIFDSSANAQRAQALCLVELQKRCKLEAIRDEAIKEVLASSGNGSGDDDDFSRFDKHHHRFSGKLNALLSPHKAAMPNHQNDSSYIRTRDKLHGHGSWLPKRAPKQQLLPTLSTSNVSVASRARSRENTTRPEENHRIIKSNHAKEDSGTTNNGSDPNEIMTRHAHIANVLSQLRVIGVQSSSSSHDEPDSRSGSRRSIINAAATNIDADFLSGNQILSNTEAWRDRSTSYVTIAERVSADLRHRSERKRWDCLMSFTSIEKAMTIDNKPLLKRVQLQRERLAIAAAGVGISLQPEQDGSARESITEKRLRMEKQYRVYQEQIQLRLQSEKASGLRPRQSKTALPKPSTVTVSADPPLQLTLIGAVAVMPTLQQHRASTVPLSSSNSTDNLQPRLSASAGSVARSQSLHGSVSAPVLEMFDSLPNNDFRRRTQIMTRQQMRTRHRKESLIGAPAVSDSSTIGRHSNARMEERRYSALTWAWHAPDARADLQNAFDAVMEENNDVERLDSDADSADESPERRDEDDDSDSDGSEATSSSRPPDSARSSRSAVSPTSSKTRHAPSKHKKKKLTSTNSNSNLLSVSANALHMQLRIESIWKALEMPFSLRLIMLEKYADVADADAFQTALRYWEQAADAVVIRERMIYALQEYGERKTLSPVSLFTEAEWTSVRLMQISAPPYAEKITVAGFIAWINAQINAVTMKCQVCARELKTQTGDDLHFQGAPYPPSHRGF